MTVGSPLTSSSKALEARAAKSQARLGFNGSEAEGHLGTMLPSSHKADYAVEKEWKYTALIPVHPGCLTI